MKFERQIRFVILSLVLTCVSGLSFAQVPKGKAIPASPTSYIYDETGKLSPEFKSELFQKLSNEDRAHGNQLVVAFFNSLDDEDLVDYTTRVFKAWNPGAKGKDNGVLVAAYLKEHKLRIEVGYGLEPYITDAKSKDVILNDLTPAFKAGNFDQGVGQAVVHLLQIAHRGQGITDEGAAPIQGATTDAGTDPLQGRHVPVLLIIIILFLLIRMVFGRRGGFFPIFFGGFGGGGFGGGGFGGGGGGFGGGGGSSGGGGASGSW